MSAENGGRLQPFHCLEGQHPYGLRTQVWSLKAVAGIEVFDVWRDRRGARLFHGHSVNIKTQWAQELFEKAQCTCFLRRYRRAAHKRLRQRNWIAGIH